MNSRTDALRESESTGGKPLHRWLASDWHATTPPRENPELVASAIATNLLSLALPILVLQVYDRIIPNQASSTLILCLVGMGVVLLIDAFLNIARSYVLGWNAARSQHELATTAIGRLLGSDTDAFEKNSVGNYIQSLRAIDTLRGFHASQTLFLWIDVPFAILFLGLIALIGGPVVFAPILILALVAVLARWSGTALRDALEERTGSDRRRHSFMIDALAKVGTAKALGMESLLVRRYERLQSQSARSNYHTVLYSVLARSIGVMMSQVMMVVVAAAGSVMVISGSLSIGSLAACTLLAGRIGSPLMRLLGIWTQFQSVAIANHQLTELLAIPQEKAGERSEDRPDEAAGKDDEHATPIPELKLGGAIELQNVTFAYATRKHPALRAANLRIEPGDTIGITGSNTAGKSTLLHLIAGLLHPQSGRILIDGRDIRSFAPETLRRQICYLPQRSVMFEGTILENLTTFRTEERLDRAFAMAQSLGLNDMIARLPDGFDTKISSGLADGLPVGLRQRIGVARALTAVARPKFILFDEANALLDKSSDDLLIELLRQHKGTATIVIISHRPALLALADRLLEIEEGEIIPQRAPQLAAPASLPTSLENQGAA
jgi:ATP-binding cassette subfamily C protein LapB